MVTLVQSHTVDAETIKSQPYDIGDDFGVWLHGLLSVTETACHQNATDCLCTSYTRVEALRLCAV